MLSSKLISSFRKILINEYTHNKINLRNISVTTRQCREVDDRKEMYRSLPTMDEGTAGEKAADIDALINQ